MIARTPRGGVIVSILCLIVGIVIGLAAAIGPRFMKIDPMKYIKPELAFVPPVEEKPVVEETDESKLSPRERELRGMIEEVKKQRAALAEREKPLLAREQELDNKTRALEALKGKIEEAEVSVKKLQVEQSAEEAKNIKRLAKIWGQMDPSEASNVVTSVDPELAARVLYSMSDEQTAPIFGVLIANNETKKLTSELITTYKRLKPTPKPETR